MILYLLLILCPFRLPVPNVPTPPVFRQVCIAMELVSPTEYVSRRLRPALDQARHVYKETRNAPSVVEAEMLPDHETCNRAWLWYDERICYVERQRTYFGQYRWQDFEPLLDALKERREYWQACATATNPSDSMMARRRALMKLR